MLLYNKILIHEKVYILLVMFVLTFCSCGEKGTTYSETDFMEKECLVLCHKCPRECPVL